jgi:hypothetical protein
MHEVGVGGARLTSPLIAIIVFMPWHFHFRVLPCASRSAAVIVQHKQIVSSGYLSYEPNEGRFVVLLFAEALT